MSKLVSIIMPMYNAEKYIKESIKSVLNQTYEIWELLIIDDVSTDNSLEIVEEYVERDSRIKLFRLDENSGPAVARNVGIKNSIGDFISFLDSDDLWHAEKLEIQLRFMIDNNYSITCTDYEQIDEEGQSRNKIIKTKIKADYDMVLKYNPIGNLTVMYNVDKLGKIKIPNIKKRNDYLLWLTILKKEKYIYGINQVLASYRVHPNSISSNKFELVKYHWHIYRKIENISFIKSLYLIFLWGFIKVFRIK